MGAEYSRRTDSCDETKDHFSHFVCERAEKHISVQLIVTNSSFMTHLLL